MPAPAAAGGHLLSVYHKVSEGEGQCIIVMGGWMDAMSVHYPPDRRPYLSIVLCLQQSLPQGRDRPFDFSKVRELLRPPCACGM